MSGGEHRPAAGAGASARCWLTPAVVLLSLLAILPPPPAGADPREPGLVPHALRQQAWQRGSVRVLVRLDAGPAAAAPEGRHRSRGEILARRLDIEAAQAWTLGGLRGLAHRTLHRYRTVPLLALEMGPDALAALEALRGPVVAVQEDRPEPPLLAESTEILAAPLAWAAGADGLGTVVAVLDTGVDGSHPFLAGKVVHEACFSIGGNCPNGQMSHVDAGAAIPCDYAPEGCGHGTHVAGIAAGDGDGAGIAFSGVAKGAGIMAIQIFSRFTDTWCIGAGEDPCPLAYVADQIAALEHVYEQREAHPIAAVNMSLGGGASTQPCDWDARKPIIDNLRAAGIATVIAAGNGGLDSALALPACISSAISVGSTADGSLGTVADVVVSSSNSASFLSLLAPGRWITSSFPGAGYAAWSGTSMAAPHVAGALAILRETYPDASVDDLLGFLHATGQPVTDPRNGIATPRVELSLVDFGSPEFVIGEDEPRATIVVHRHGSTRGTVTVDYEATDGTAVAGQDYVPTAGTLTFEPGQDSRSFTVSLVGDTRVDGPRTVRLALGRPGGGALLGRQETAALLIQDNDTGGSVQFSSAAYAGVEDDPAVTITVTRTGGTASEVSVDYQTAAGGSAIPGTDFVPVTGTLTFGAGETSRTFEVPLLPDSVLDGPRTVHLALSAPAGGATLGTPAAAVLTVADDETTIELAAPTYSVTEGGTATVTVTRAGVMAGTVSVDYRTVPGSATSDLDYRPAAGTLTFGPGVKSRTFTIRTVEDQAAEPPESVLLVLERPGGGAVLGPRSAAALTIRDDDGDPPLETGTIQLEAPALIVSEASGTAKVAVTRIGAATRPVTVAYATTPGTATPGTATACPPGADYRPAAGTLAFKAGQASRTISVRLCQDSVMRASRTFGVVLGAVTGPASLGSPGTAVVTIQDDDGPGALQFQAAAFTTAEGSRSATITVTRTGGAAGSVSARYATTPGTAVEGQDYRHVEGTIAFGPGVTRRTFTVPLVDDRLADGLRTVGLALSDPQGGATLGSPGAATLAIADDEPTVRFSAAAYSVKEKANAATIKVVRGGSAGGTVTVRYQTADGTAEALADYGGASGLLTFLPGQSSRTFTVPLADDALAEGDETVTLTLSDPTGATLGVPSTATLTIADDDAGGAVEFAADHFGGREGAGSAIVAVTRTGGAAAGVTVDYAATAGGSATAGADFQLASGTLTFAAGETVRTFEVPLLVDGTAESPETVRLRLSAPGGGAVLGARSTATLWILDGP